MEMLSSSTWTVSIHYTYSLQEEFSQQKHPMSAKHKCRLMTLAIKYITCQPSWISHLRFESLVNVNMDHTYGTVNAMICWWHVLDQEYPGDWCSVSAGGLLGIWVFGQIMNREAYLGPIYNGLMTIYPICSVITLGYR